MMMSRPRRSQSRRTKKLQLPLLLHLQLKQETLRELRYCRRRSLPRSQPYPPRQEHRDHASRAAVAAAEAAAEIVREREVRRPQLQRSRECPRQMPLP
jgi:hypothetical protein